MKDISIYFQPISQSTDFNEEQLGSIIDAHTKEFPDLSSSGCAIIYVPEYRGVLHENETADKEIVGPGNFRDELYSLYKGSQWKTTIYDLGNLLPGKELKDTYFALSQVVAELVKNNILPIVIGGSQDLTTAMFIGYEELEQLINTCTIDSKLDLGTPEEPITHEKYIGSLLIRRPCYLFNHANIGLQIPFAQPKELDLFEKLFFDVCRLGEFNADFKTAEPILRNSDIISFDFQAIRASETNNKQGNPNGFYADQACQISKYAGISDKATSFGIFNCFSDKSIEAKLIAQMTWYFLDGFFSRKGDFPKGSKMDYTKFTVFLENGTHEIVFYRSNKSDRWWMEVPYPPSEFSKFERHHLVPCNKFDYDRAMKNEMPDLWWKTYQKLG